MRKIIIEEEKKGVEYPVVTDDEIKITHKLLKKLSLRQLKFNDDLSALVPYELSEEQILIEENNKIRKEIKVIEKWFELYDRQIAEFNRCSRLGIVYDSKYGAIEALDNQAIVKSLKINELHSRLDENTDKLRFMSEQCILQQSEKLQPPEQSENKSFNKRIKRFF